MFLEAFERETGRKLVPWQKKQYALLTWAPVTFGILAEAPGVANTQHTSHLQHTLQQLQLSSEISRAVQILYFTSERTWFISAICI